jgi:hypothetical protein
MHFDPSQIFSFLHLPLAQTTLFILRIIAIIIGAGMIGFIIWALIKTSYLEKLFFIDFQEFFRFRPYGTKKIYSQWQKIKLRLAAGIESEYKLAVIEADSMIDDILNNMGFKGTNLGERLENLNSVTMPNIEEVKEAHQIRNNIVHNPDQTITLSDAKKFLEIYEIALNDLQVL